MFANVIKCYYLKFHRICAKQHSASLFNSYLAFSPSISFEFKINEAYWNCYCRALFVIPLEVWTIFLKKKAIYKTENPDSHSAE